MVGEGKDNSALLLESKAVGGRPPCLSSARANSRQRFTGWSCAVSRRMLISYYSGRLGEAIKRQGNRLTGFGPSS